uniref:Uncharacterized protein n=1 Tax=Aegilops tauschii subsp. strangulata TaxID=200361 RepID=A0A453Q4D2_AEGTS
PALIVPRLPLPPLPSSPPPGSLSSLQQRRRCGMQRTRPASALSVSLSAVEQRRQCGTQRLGRSDGFLRRGRRGLASLPTSSSYSSSVALVSALEPAGAEGMRTEVAQIQGGNNDGRPTSPSRAAAQSSSASMACSKGSQSYPWVIAWSTVAVPLARRLHFLLVPQYRQRS